MRGPADIGNGIVCASFTADGSWLSVGAADQGIGFVELSGLAPFDEAERGHVAAVREYRNRMTDRQSAFLIVDGADPFERAAVPGTRTVEQRYTIAPDERTATVDIEFRGRVDRPAYAEVTDVSPLPPLETEPSLTVAGGRLLVGTGRPGMGAVVQVTPPAAAETVWTLTEATRATMTFPVVSGDRAGARTFEVSCTLGADPVRRSHVHRGATPVTRATAIPPTSSWLSLPAPWRDDIARIAHGAVRYTLDCTALDVGPEETAILTDHRLLPLSWTRDAYYQAQAVLARSGRGASPAVTRIGNHLRWLWVRCDRPDGLWQRSYQANGAVKDWALQADQQLYPVLELLDHRAASSDWPRGVDDWGGRVRSLWSALPRDDETGLLTSHENPADDDARALPILLSAQVLYWHTANRLCEHAGALGLDDLDLGSIAAEIRARVLERFAVDGPFGRQWSSAIDDDAGYRLDHDANDLPVALAPSYGFVAPDDPVWNATMRFAFSPDNPAYVAGSMGGLGSPHTPGVWPLGDIQEWVWASWSGDRERVDAVLGRLCAVANADGFLPETYDPESGAWWSRQWFAWPSSTVAALVYGAYG
ncbi:hypothetical protein BH24ACT5_BH24ACT5_14740 [soil metagenome]